MTGLIWPDGETDAATLGGKAHALARLQAAGFDVPPFAVLPASAFSERDGQALATLDLADVTAEVTARLGPGPFAVRSSARAEDGAAASHAGQFETVLNVPPEGLCDALARVWLSSRADHVARYRAETGQTDNTAPAMIVQTMLAPRAAGVAFSADPVSGRRDRVVISAVEGLADGLVAGEVDGEDWTLSPDGTPLDPIPTTEVLSNGDAAEVAALARRAETAFGAPQDIEWAFANGQLWILQSRPITTALRPEPAGETGLVVLDNSNIIESYPGHVSPLTYSFAAGVYARVYRAFVALLGVDAARIADHAAVFDNMLARVDGRIYYNLGNWYRALALLPGFSLNRAHMETMMGVDDPLPAELADTIGPAAPQGLAKIREWGRVARVGAGLMGAAILLPRTKRRFMARLDEALRETEGVERAGLTELAAMYRRIESALLDRWDAPLINDFLCMMAFGASRKMLETWAGPAGLAAHNDIMIGQGDVISAEPARRIVEMGRMTRAAGLADRLEAEGLGAAADNPELDRAISAYLDRFSDRCTEELKLESLTLEDDPTPLLAAIAHAARRETGTGTGTDTAPPGDPDWRALIPGRPMRRALARWVTRYAKARVRDRENLRFERTRIFGAARRVVRAMGRELYATGRIDAARDVFCLTIDEVLGAIEGFGTDRDLAAIAARRSARAKAEATRPDPPSRILHRGTLATLSEAMRMDTSAPPEDTGPLRQGTGCSAGTVTAPARVVRDPRKEALAPGDILVARHTDPGWIAVFSNASAIVVERGSLLSHSAIVAREMGLPCVVGLKGATDWIPDGATLRVDGETGDVEILS